MRLTIDVDDETLARAIALTGFEDRAKLIQNASNFWCASKVDGSWVLLREATEMLWLHHVGVDSAFGVRLTGSIDAALGGV